MTASRTPFIVALLALAAAVPAGCGDDSAGSPSAKPVAQSDDAAIEQYVAEMVALTTPVTDASSDYFHAPNTRAAAKEWAGRIGKAYTAAAAQLEALAPPAKASEVHRKLLAVLHKRAGQVKAVATEKPFEPARLSELMSRSHRDWVLLDDAYRLY